MKKENTQPSYGYINEISIGDLKGIKNLTLSLGRGITCLIGPNGIGKTTIIHALACVYRARYSNDVAHSLSEFFRSYSGQDWKKSCFTVDLREGNNSSKVQYYRKEKWSPRNTRKKKRSTIYIGLSTCVPAIELEKSRSKIKMAREERKTNARQDVILAYFNKIMEKQYTEIFHYSYEKKIYLGVSEKSSEEAAEKSYCSLSMSAGEQRCIQILQEVVNAPDNSLILIEELDILLHQRALLNIVDVLKKVAKDKHHQIIFSCHNPVIRNVKGIDFRCLERTPQGDLCAWPNFFEYSLFDLTGEKENLIRIYVEDELARSIVEKVLAKMRLRSKACVIPFGCARNAFTLTAGLEMSAIKQEYLIVLDGDVLNSRQEQIEELERVYSTREITERFLERIVHFNNPQKGAPERYIVEEIKKGNFNNEDERELYEAIKSASQKVNAHDLLREPFSKLGLTPSVGCSKVVDLFSRTSGFHQFVSPVEAAIMSIKEKLENGNDALIKS